MRLLLGYNCKAVDGRAVIGGDSKLQSSWVLEKLGKKNLRQCLTICIVVFEYFVELPFTQVLLEVYAGQIIVLQLEYLLHFSKFYQTILVLKIMVCQMGTRNANRKFDGKNLKFSLAFP